jgi:cyclic-di-GMP-binding protein
MATQTYTSLKSSSMFFADARSCKHWLTDIPLTNVAQAQQNLLDALRMMNLNADFQPVERLTCMELFRDKVAYLLSEQRIRYAFKTIPLTNSEYTAWTTSKRLIQEMAAGFRRCWVDAVGTGNTDNEADAPLNAHAALILQRIIRYLGLEMLICGFVYRSFDPELWARLHTQWIEAEQRNLTAVRVKDSIGSADGYSNIMQAYTAVILGQLANVQELSPHQIDFVDGIMKRFGHKVYVTREAVANSQGLTPVIDLFGQAGASFVATPSPAEHLRMLQVDDLSRSLRRRIKKLSEGEDPETLDLPVGWSTYDAIALLTRLRKLWCENGSTALPATVPSEKEAVLTFGITETHFLLSGDLFEQPDVKRDLTRQEKNDIAMFGKISEATIRAKYANFNYGTETWQIISESRGLFRLARPNNSPRGVAIGGLVAMRVGADRPFFLGVIRELFDDPDSFITVTIGLLPGKPEGISVRSGELSNRAGLTYVQGFRLPPTEALKIPETLIIPRGLAPKGNGIDVFHPGHGSPTQVKLVEFIERGLDFDQVTLA